MYIHVSGSVKQIHLKMILCYYVKQCKKMSLLFRKGGGGGIGGGKISNTFLMMGQSKWSIISFRKLKKKEKRTF